jgi:MerR family copper efflux transcriptional regulator
MAKELTIGKAAHAAGVGVETIRFYERQQLIMQPPKPQAKGVRLYPVETVERVRFIKKAQELGFSLREVQELLELQTSPTAGCFDVRERAKHKLDHVQRKIQHLLSIATVLERLIADCRGYGSLETCSIMTALSQTTAPAAS